jgi:parallel beta-helix repeat protein
MPLRLPGISRPITPPIDGEELGAHADTHAAAGSDPLLPDAIGAIAVPAGSTHGDLLYRSATGWTRLAAGVAGKYLKTAGAGADPIWDAVISVTPVTLVVAAADSKNPSRADYQVPAGSTSAQTVINQAVNALPAVGGKVTVIEGTYIVDGSIVLPSNVHLEILKGATIKLKNGFNADIDIITNADKTNGNSNIVITGGGTIDGNKANNTAGNICGIFFGLVTKCQISGIVVKDCRTYGICLSTNIKWCFITDNLVEGNLQDGILFYWSGNESNIIAGNICRLNGSGIRLYVEAKDNIVARNICEGNTYYGVALHGFYADMIENFVTGNIIRRNGDHGIYIVRGYRNNITNNICVENSQTTSNTSDNIHHYSGDYNNIQGNICRQGALTNRPRYGIRISFGTGNLVTNNDCYDGGLTNGISDAGTATSFGAGNRNRDGTWSTTPN